MANLSRANDETAEPSARLNRRSLHLEPDMSVLDDQSEQTPLLQLPVTAGEPKPSGEQQRRQPPALLGISCVAASALSFSLMTACIKFNTYSMTSMEAVFWRSFAAFLFNYVRFALICGH